MRRTLRRRAERIDYKDTISLQKKKEPRAEIRKTNTTAAETVREDIKSPEIAW